MNWEIGTEIHRHTDTDTHTHTHTHEKEPGLPRWLSGKESVC